MVLFYIVIDFSPTSTTTNARFACALYLRPEGQSFTALFDKNRLLSDHVAKCKIARLKNKVKKMVKRKHPLPFLLRFNHS
ncbi:hypothetical protein JP33_05755 [Gallibacterium anatis CCM5995]|nr:hypothetical protein JP33_05755 [Gallibacterium anatis CCM5995]